MNYQNTKIYKIMSHLGDKIYIGSTTKNLLSQRMVEHRKGYNEWKAGKRTLTTSYKLFDEYGIDNCIIILVEAYPCNSKDEKNAKEAYYIQNCECVNKYIPGRTPKKYYEDNILAVKIRQQTIVECECGVNYSTSNKARHIKRRHTNMPIIENI